MGRSSSDFGREHLRSLGRRLRELREARSWSLKRLSSESGVSIAAIQKIEGGETNPNLLTVLAIADVLGESVDRLVAVSRKASQISNVVRGTLPARPRRIRAAGLSLRWGWATVRRNDNPRASGGRPSTIVATRGRMTCGRVSCDRACSR